MTKLLIVFACAVLALTSCDKITALTEPDPAKEMKKVADEFPSQSRFADSTFEFWNVQYNVRKTDSLVSPIVGTIDFNEGSVLELRCVFHWKDGHWKFERMYNRENELDWEQTHGGIQLMSSDNMRAYLEKYGWSGAIEDPAAIARRVAALKLPATPRPVSAPRTPTPQERAQQQALEVARKYASPK